MSTQPELKETYKLEGIRKVIASRMSESKRTAPHVYYDIDVDMTAARAIKESYAGAGEKISYNDIIIYATALILKEFPHFNAHLVEDELQVYQEINIGMAVGLEKGLIVPVIHQTDQMGLPELAQRSKELVKSAKAGRLKLADYTGGTFTTSNLGMYGLNSFHAVINPPEVAILAIGRVSEKPVVTNGVIRVGMMTTLSLSADHRVIDGKDAASFLKTLKSAIEAI